MPEMPAPIMQMSATGVGDEVEDMLRFCCGKLPVPGEGEAQGGGEGG